MFSTEFSDHYPIKINICIKRTTTALNVSKWNFKRADWSAYEDILKREIEVMAHPDIISVAAIATTKRPEYAICISVLIY